MKSYRCSSKNNNILMSCYRFEGNLRIQKDMKKDIEQLFVLFEKEKKNILEQEKIQKYLTKCRQKKLLNTKKEELKNKKN